MSCRTHTTEEELLSLGVKKRSFSAKISSLPGENQELVRRALKQDPFFLFYSNYQYRNDLAAIVAKLTLSRGKTIQIVDLDDVVRALLSGGSFFQEVDSVFVDLSVFGGANKMEVKALGRLLSQRTRQDKSVVVCSSLALFREQESIETLFEYSLAKLIQREFDVV